MARQLMMPVAMRKKGINDIVGTEGARGAYRGGSGRGDFVVKSDYGHGRPYYEQKRNADFYRTEAEARAAAKSIKDADKVTIQRYDGSKWHLLED
jgi:hypothetical protein